MSVLTLSLPVAATTQLPYSLHLHCQPLDLQLLPLDHVLDSDQILMPDPAQERVFASLDPTVLGRPTEYT